MRMLFDLNFDGTLSPVVMSDDHGEALTSPRKLNTIQEAEAYYHGFEAGVILENHGGVSELAAALEADDAEEEEEPEEPASGC